MHKKSRLDQAAFFIGKMHELKEKLFPIF